MHLMRRFTIGFLAALVAGPAVAVYAVPGTDTDGLQPVAAMTRDSVAASAAGADSLRGRPVDSSMIVRTPLPERTPPAASRIVRKKVDLDAPVVFSSADSMVILRRDSAFMYGNSSVTYGDIKLDAEQIEMNLGDNTVYAVGRADSVGEVKGTPVFHEGGSDYEAKTMRYNFKTSKGIITNVGTQQGEGYLTGGLTKKDVDDSYYIKDGRYTTCDNHDDPHFYMQLTKAKVRPGKNVITGPAYMVLAGLPLPLAVPFGYFPFSEKYASGVIVPTFGDDYNRGLVAI